MDNVSWFAAGAVLGILASAVYGILKEAKRLDAMDAGWLKEQDRMRRRDL